MTSLIQREIDILKTIVEDYIVNAQPVGSRTVSKQSGLRLSPASMRNVMVDLTEKGYLHQPHTSAGRVPTVNAFRFYINHHLQPQELSEEDRNRIAAYLVEAGLDLSDVLGQASRLISTLSRQVSMVIAPSRGDARWREIDFVLLKPGLVLAVLILDGGIVQNKVLEVEAGLTKDDLVYFSNYLNEHYRGLTLSQARARVQAELEGARKRLKDLYRRALHLARNAVESAQDRDIFLDGTANILNNAEFSDVEKIREILHLLEERSRILTLLDETIQGDGIKILFGSEAELEDFSECGVISSPYVDDATTGMVGVIGPMRMNYAQVVPVVDYIAKTLTLLLKSRY